ncbi:hypothetical protein HDU81_007181 [Chytriomyces hyalinus]|nr:hypothetical protein HDU81_007181 [Chytriomyces hyalinus]
MDTDDVNVGLVSPVLPYAAGPSLSSPARLQTIDPESRPRISYPFSDTEDSDTDLSSSPITRFAAAGATPSMPAGGVPSFSSNNPAPPLPMPVAIKKSGRKSNGVGMKSVREQSAGDGDADDSDEGLEIADMSGSENGGVRQNAAFSSVGSAGNSGSIGLGWGSLDAEKVLKSGYLKKKGEKRKTWKTRWFVLRTTKLAYYKNEKEYELLNIIPLQNITTVADVDLQRRSNVFGLVTRERTFYFQASGPTEMESWIFLMREAQREVQKVTGGPPPPVRSRILSASENNHGIPSPPLSADTVGSPPQSMGRNDVKVQFADMVITGSVPKSTGQMGIFGSKGTSSLSMEAISNSFKRPILGLSSTMPSAPAPAEISPLDSDAHSQLSARDSVESSLLTYASTPSMLPVASSSSSANELTPPAISSELAKASQHGHNLQIPLHQSRSMNSPSALQIDSVNMELQISDTPSNAYNGNNQRAPVEPVESSSTVTPDSNTISDNAKKSAPDEIMRRDETLAAPQSTSIIETTQASLRLGATDTSLRANAPASLAPSTAGVSGPSTSTGGPALKSALRKPRNSFPVPLKTATLAGGAESGLTPGSAPSYGGNALSRALFDSFDGDEDEGGKQNQGGAYTLSSSDEDEDGGLFSGRGVAGKSEGGGGVNDNVVVREGYLQKQGLEKTLVRLEKWQTHELQGQRGESYLAKKKVTHQREIADHHSKHSQEYVVKRIIPLRTVLDILEIDPLGKSQFYCFKVVLPKRNLILAAASAEEMVMWIDDLRNVHTQLKGHL